MFLFSLLLSVCNNVQAQVKGLSSQRIDELLSYSNLDSTQLALTIASEIGNDYFKERSLIKLANNYIEEGSSSYALPYKLQLLELYKKHKVTEKIYSESISIGDLYQFEELPAKALYYYHNAKLMLDNNVKEENVVCSKLSAAYLLRGIVDSALYYQNHHIFFIFLFC